MKTLFEVHMPKYLQKLEATLDQEPNFKFICGDKVTIYDMAVAGYFHNVVLNPKADHAAGWAECIAKHCSERITRYLQNFREEFNDYLKNRPESIY